MKTFVITLAIVGMLLTTSCLALADDKSDRLNQESSYTFSPGYINAAKYQAESLLKVKIPDYKEKGFFEKAVDYVKDKMGYNARQQQAAGQNINPELQQKTSQQDATQTTAAALIDSANYNVMIGNGTNKVYENSRLISEVIDGARHIYVGFNNAGKSTITAAVALTSAGDKVIVKGGTYNESISIKDGVSMYGGYRENGRQDSVNTPTIINGKFTAAYIRRPTEVSGFTVNVPTVDTTGGSGFLLNLFNPAYAFNIRSSSNITVRNNIFGGDARYGIYVNLSNVIIKNNVFNSNNGVYIDGVNGYPGFRLIAVCCGPPVVVTANPQAPVIYTVRSENNNFCGTQGIKVTSDNITISTHNDYYSEKIREGDRLYYVNRPISVANDMVLKPNNNMIIFKKPKNVIIQNAKLDTSAPYYVTTAKGIDMSIVVPVFKELLEKKNDISQGQSSQMDHALLVKIVESSLNKSIPFSQDQVSQDEKNIAIALASIIANPTEDQKVVIDSITSLLNDMENLRKETGTNPELAKASSDLLQMVANVLLAQAIPDLLKEGDIQGIKGIFSQLDSGKSKVILEYKEATKPYYEEVKKLIEKNASVLDIDLNLKNLIQKELKEIPRSEIDKILEKLKNKAKKTFEEEYILQQEEKAKAKYIDPNKKKLEENMKKMLEDFTKKLSATLESKK